MRIIIFFSDTGVLIETYWTVNLSKQNRDGEWICVLIETYWNVNLIAIGNPK